MIFGVLTLFTQIGGVLWLLFIPVSFWLKKWARFSWQRLLLQGGSFMAFYMAVSILLLPTLAKWQCGRVPLPVFENHHLKPHSIFYFCLLNHHYVRPEVKTSMEKVAKLLSEKYPGTKIYNLDANFPFFNGYPLQPHFTHRNGTTVDIALHWLDASTNETIEGSPVALAYGASATPLPGEVDLEQQCDNWLRSIEMKIARNFYEEKKYLLDEHRTAEMTRFFAKENSVKKILFEPHLKTRLGLGKYDKIRFQGCKAARHDDHIHVIW